MIRKLIQSTVAVVATLTIAAASSGVASAAALTVVNTKIISSSPAGDPGDNYAKGSYGPVISSNGRYVAFSSQSQNLVPGVEPTTRQIFVYDRLFRTMEVASRTSGTDELADSMSLAAGISDNGRYVVFNSAANNLAAEHSVAGGVDRVYIRDRQAGTTRLVSAGTEGGFAQPHGVSRDANIIAYGTMHYGTGSPDVDTQTSYLYNRTLSLTTPLPGGAQESAYNSNFAAPGVSGNGLYATYTITTVPAVPGEVVLGEATTYRYNVLTGISLPIETGANLGATLDADGSHAMYYYFQEPTDPDDTGVDVYTENIITGTKQLVTDNTSAASIATLSLSDNAQRVSYLATSTNGRAGVYTRDLSTNTELLIRNSTALGNTTLTANGLELAYDGSTSGFGNNFQVFVAQFATDAPLVSLTSPTPNTNVSGTVTLTSSVYSSLNYSHIFYVFNSSSQIVASHYQYNVPASTGVLNYSWDTTTVPNGTYKVYASAKDSANHKEAYSTDYYFVTVAN